MGTWMGLDTPHGNVRAWREAPATAPRGGIVVLQEIFGVNAHIRAVTGRFAAAGFVAIAPSLCDPVEPAVELAYDDGGVARGRELVAALGFERAIDIVAAAADPIREDGLRVGAVGFCWGGSLAFLSNTRLGLPAVSYYGARSIPFIDEPARAPMLFHFGELDPTIPPGDIERHRTSQPDAQVHVYPAKHGFNRDISSHVHEPASAALAWQRTQAFFAEHLA
ncbi:dienelactone hydrolase family protein [Cognatilysobacter bugurensis]|uniref:Carboxymethylenebutenolidase n=1 Tax=Cognatilysobacter bugurensis TaxID=543356 RepID=A0A918SWL4_9GAMM|nr:dienelactone hydrolase family protein [Lysobacter bugurensis]GHA70926.1 carboxymethylenebutenolidase [Lysobacter bugurensis]